MEFDKKVLSARLRAKRAELRLSQQQLADRCKNVSSAAIAQYENEENPGYIPSANKVWELAVALGVSPSWLLGWDTAHEKEAV